MKNLNKRIIALREKGYAIADISAVVHTDYKTIVKVLAEHKYETAKETAVEVKTEVTIGVKGLWEKRSVRSGVKAAGAYVVSIATKFMAVIPVVNVVTGAKGALVISTFGNFILLFISTTALLVWFYYLLDAFGFIA